MTAPAYDVDVSDAAEVTPRAAVAVFATHMESKLRENDHRGGWEDCDFDYLTRRLAEEARELRRAVDTFEDARYSHGATAADLIAIAAEVRREAADVANFAMMIADNSHRIAR